MQLKQLIQDIAEYTVKNEIVECAMGGLSLYEINFKENNNYPLLFISPSTNHTISNNTITYQIVIYYIDRLLRDNDNNIDIVNASVSKLQQIINIIRNFDNVLKLNSDYQITNFADTQRLTDCVAGGSVTLSITVQNTQGICAIDAVLPTIKVVLQNKNVEITENGEYNVTFDNGYTGLKEVKVDVNIDTESYYNNGYNEGYTEGEVNGRAEQKSLLESIKITENGVYDNENGFDEITVDVDTSGAYNEGFDKGKAEGVEQGKEEQKALLESITITENGTYTNENGYDEVIVDVPTGGGEGDYEQGYEEGYNQSKQDIIDNAQTLYVTKNGTYGIERAVTGYYDDGTPFYDYAILNNVVFATGIEVSPETEVEVWFKTTQYMSNEGIVASQNAENTLSIFKLVEGEGYFTGEIGGTQPNIFDMEGAKLELNKWYHLKMSYINGLWVNGKQVGDYQDLSNVVPPYFELFINGYSNQDWYGYAGLNNYFGMVKINGQTFIPKENTFWNITEDYGLNLSVMGDNAYYEFKKDTGEYPLENLIKEVIVDVPTGGGDAGDYEEGYNKGYEEGIANAEEEIAETAQVLHITENGRYTTKYTDVSVDDAVVTGYFDDGTPFYNYGFCNQIGYNTGIKVTPTTTLELWYRSDDWENETDIAIVASQNPNNYNAIFKITKDWFNVVKAEIAQENISAPISMKNGEWYHFKLSHKEGFWVNGEFIGNISNNVTEPTFELCINSFVSSDVQNSSSSAYFGMIKIDNQTIIPTEQGFYNVTTERYLDAITGESSEYLYTEAKSDFTGNLIKEVIVDVPIGTGGYEEGYNKGYGEGVANAEEEIAESAQVLYITKNGTYKTKFSEVTDSDVVITGYFDDGTPFYDYGFCNQISYDTGIQVSPTTKIELWYKSNDYRQYDVPIIGSQSFENTDAIFKLIENEYNIEAHIKTDGVVYSGVQDNKWYHLKMSYEEGFWVNDEFIGDWYGINDNVVEPFTNLFINNYGSYNQTGSDNYYGMIKIDGQTIIPTELGFYNVTTERYLDVYTNGDYRYTKGSSTPVLEGNLIKEVTVEVDTSYFYSKGYDEGYMAGETSGYETGYSEGFGWGKEEQKSLLEPITITENGTYTNENGYSEITVEVPTSGGDSSVLKIPNGMKLGYSSEIPSNIDTSEVVDMSYMFAGCRASSIPSINTSNVTNMSYMFSSCDSLTEIPLIDTSNVTNMQYAFSYCEKITTIPLIDTSKVTKMERMFNNCYSLVSIPSLYCGNITTKNYLNPLYCIGTKVYEHLTDVGGFIDMKYSWDNDYGLPKCPNLSYQSCINILNGLYDFTGNGETPNSNQGQLKVHQNFLDLVGDEISIGTNKGWNIFV